MPCNACVVDMIATGQAEALQPRATVDVRHRLIVNSAAAVRLIQRNKPDKAVEERPVLDGAARRAAVDQSDGFDVRQRRKRG